MNNNIDINKFFLKIVGHTYFDSYEKEDIETASISLSKVNRDEQRLLAKQLLCLLEKNRFSATLLSNCQHLFCDEETKELIQEKIEKDFHYVRKYFTILKHTIKTLNEENIDYVLIKHYLMQHVKMLDVDLHISDADEILRACEALNRLGAIFYDFRFFSHPFKLGMKILPLDPPGEVSVEIYPEIAVGRIIVGPIRRSRDGAIKVTITDIVNGVFEARTLPITENIYTMLTHDWYSQYVPLSTVVYLLINIHQCCVDKLQQLGVEYGTIPSVYTILKIASALDKILQFGILDEKAHKVLDRLNFPGKALIDKWIKKVEWKLEFPLAIPYKFILLSIPHHATKIIKKSGVIETLYDTYSHFTPLLTYLYRIGRRFVHV
jgi:hypothetical protein